MSTVLTSRRRLCRSPTVTWSSAQPMYGLWRRCEADLASGPDLGVLLTAGLLIKGGRASCARATACRGSAATGPRAAVSAHALVARAGGVALVSEEIFTQKLPVLGQEAAGAPGVNLSRMRSECDRVSGVSAAPMSRIKARAGSGGAHSPSTRATLPEGLLKPPPQFPLGVQLPPQHRVLRVLRSTVARSRDSSSRCSAITSGPGSSGTSPSILNLH